MKIVSVNTYKLVLRTWTYNWGIFVRWLNHMAKLHNTCHFLYVDHKIYMSLSICLYYSHAHIGNKAFRLRPKEVCFIQLFTHLGCKIN